MPAPDVQSWIDAWRARAETEEARRRAAQTEAFAVAARVAALLRERHGARRVVLFASLARGTWVPERSDIDLTFEGVSESGYLSALGAAQMCALGPVDLVRLEDASASLSAAVEREGKEL
jgi:hypothetical protein